MRRAQHELTRTKSRVHRWCALLRRVGTTNSVAAALGVDEWRAFMARATKLWRPRLEGRFLRGPLRCEGMLEPAAPCPREFELAGTLPLDQLRRALPELHMDHRYDVNHICETWRRALLSGEAVREDAVMRLLFDTAGGGAAMVAFRCRRCHSDRPPCGQLLSTRVQRRSDLAETPT